LENRADNRRFHARLCFARRRAGRGKNRPPPEVEKRMLNFWIGKKNVTAGDGWKWKTALNR